MRSAVVSVVARRLMDGRLPAGVSARRARRTLLERKLEAFDLIAQRERDGTAREARAQASQAFDELVAWHRGDLDARLSSDGLEEPAIEGYRFALDGRPVAELQFAAEGAAEDTARHARGPCRPTLNDNAPASIAARRRPSGHADRPPWIFPWACPGRGLRHLFARTARAARHTSRWRAGSRRRRYDLRVRPG